MQVIDITPKIQAKTEKIRLAAYCRVSSNSEDQLHSFAAQIKYYSAYVKNHPEYELVDIYADEAITGTEKEKRDELNRLLEDCKKGKIDKVIVKSMTRFVRNIADCLIIVRMLKGLGIGVLFEEQSIDTKQLNSEVMITFPGILAQKESENISGNLRWGIQKRMASGDYISPTAPYGYTWVGRKLVINETEAVIVRRIFDLYLQGYGKMAIAIILNREGIPKNNKTNRWEKRAIDYILTNERYMGDAVLQKTYMTEGLPFRRKANKGEKNKYLVENYCPAIISKEIFYAAQRLMKERQSKVGERRTYILTKKLRCSECGGVFRRQVLQDKAYWLCINLATGKKICKSRRLKEEFIYETFVNMVYRLKVNQESVLGNLIRKLELLQQRTSMGFKYIKEIDKQIMDLSAKNLVITKLHTGGILSVSEYAQQTSEITNKIAELRVERKKKIEEDENDFMVSEIKDINDIIEGYELTGKFDEELFEQIVEKIVVESSSEIKFHLIGGLELTEQIQEKGRCKTA